MQRDPRPIARVSVIPMRRLRTQKTENATPKSVTFKLKRLRFSRRVFAVIVLVIGVTGFFVSAYAFHLFETTTNCWVRPTGPVTTAIFTIVMADEGVNVGYNGSKFHTMPWPVINVAVNQSVIIHVINNDSQAHGFTVTHYYDQGVGGQAGLGPGKCFDIRFVANQTGSFTIFCTILCTIHPFMLNGRLNVN